MGSEDEVNHKGDLKPILDIVWSKWKSVTWNAAYISMVQSLISQERIDRMWKILGNIVILNNTSWRRSCSVCDQDFSWEWNLTYIKCMHRMQETDALEKEIYRTCAVAYQ